MPNIHSFNWIGLIVPICLIVTHTVLTSPAQYTGLCSCVIVDMLPSSQSLMPHFTGRQYHSGHHHWPCGDKCSCCHQQRGWQTYSYVFFLVDLQMKWTWCGPCSFTTCYHIYLICYCAWSERASFAPPDRSILKVCVGYKLKRLSKVS